MSETIENLSVILLALRKKIFVIATVLCTGVIISLQFTGPLINRMKHDLLPEGAKLVYLSKRYSVRIPIYSRKGQFLLLSVAILSMFMLGASYSYFFMLPLFLKFLYIDAAASGVTATYSIFTFISFIATTTAIFGLVFELPIVLTILIRNGFVKYDTLVTYRKHIYVIILVIAMLITPGTDVFSQMMFAVPMTIFFEISMLIVKIIGVKNKIPKPDSSVSSAGISRKS